MFARFCKCIEHNLARLWSPLVAPNSPASRPRAKRADVRDPLGDRRLTCALAPLPQQQPLSHVRAHVPSRRALREDPDFDAVVTALYADAKDYDLRENAYSAHAKKTMQEDKEERERERAAKHAWEEAAAQAAAMREQYRLEAEAKRRADEEAAAARAAKKARRDEPRSKRAAARSREPPPPPRKPQNPPRVKPPSISVRRVVPDRPPPPDPASNAVATTTKPGVAVEIFDDFAGLYAVRAGDVAPRAAAGHLREDIDACFSVELRRNAMDGGVGLLSRPAVRAPGSAPSWRHQETRRGTLARR